jgi:hypothetical protein
MASFGILRSKCVPGQKGSEYKMYTRSGVQPWTAERNAQTTESNTRQQNTAGMLSIRKSSVKPLLSGLCPIPRVITRTGTRVQHRLCIFCSPRQIHICYAPSPCPNVSALCNDLGGGGGTAQNFEKWNEKLVVSDIKQFWTGILI